MFLIIHSLIEMNSISPTIIINLHFSLLNLKNILILSLFEFVYNYFIDDF